MINMNQIGDKLKNTKKITVDIYGLVKDYMTPGTREDGFRLVSLSELELLVMTKKQLRKTLREYSMWLNELIQYHTEKRDDDIEKMRKEMDILKNDSKMVVYNLSYMMSEYILTEGIDLNTSPWTELPEPVLESIKLIVNEHTPIRKEQNVNE